LLSSYCAAAAVWTNCAMFDFNRLSLCLVSGGSFFHYLKLLVNFTCEYEWRFKVALKWFYSKHAYGNPPPAGFYAPDSNHFMQI
jgi:hypothetical protein